MWRISEIIKGFRIFESKSNPTPFFTAVYSIRALISNEEMNQTKNEKE